MEPAEGTSASRFVLVSRASSDQLVRMRELAGQAFQRWQQAAHPGWNVIEADSDLLLGELEQSQVLCCAVLCCAVLCCAVLCCAVLCCAVLLCYLAFSMSRIVSLSCCTVPQMSVVGNRSDIRPAYSK